MVAHKASYTAYSVTCPWFTDADGDAISAVNISSTISGMTITNVTTCSISFSGYINSNVGTYEVSVDAYDSGSTPTEHGSIKFNLTITENTGPSNTSSVVSNITMGVGATSPHTEFSITSTSSLFTDPDSDTLTYSLSSVPSSTLFTYHSSNDTLSVGSTTNSDIGNYTLTIKATDNIAGNINATTSFNFEIIANQPPTTSEVMASISQLNYYPVNIDWDQSLFTDADGNSITATISVNISDPWFTINNTEASLTGSPNLESYNNKVYGVTLTLADSYGAQSNYSMTLTLLVNYSPTYNASANFTQDII